MTMHIENLYENVSVSQISFVNRCNLFFKWCLFQAKNKYNNYSVNTQKLEENLNVIMVISNPCNFRRRRELALEFKERMELTANVNLYIVELAYKDQPFQITSESNPRHLQVRGDIPLWHKENMINMGVTKLLPSNWKCMAWIDADLEFENKNWVNETLEKLGSKCDIMQLFELAEDLNEKHTPMSTFASFCRCYVAGVPKGASLDFWHPGYAWAITRELYDRVGGLFDKGILGSGDHHMARAFIGEAEKSFPMNIHQDYKKAVYKFQADAMPCRIGYTTGKIKHFFHGSKANRKYKERWEIINNYSPMKEITYNKDGLIIPTKEMNRDIPEKIQAYFEERNEDEIYNKN
jgi:hypothetical protein